MNNLMQNGQIDQSEQIKGQLNVSGLHNFDSTIFKWTW